MNMAVDAIDINYWYRCCFRVRIRIAEATALFNIAKGSSLRH
jgi:hypothetical protein